MDIQLGSRPRKILIIEDDRSMRKGLVLELQDRGFSVLEADSYKSGLARIKKDTFDFVITDLRLPDKNDGIKLVRELKARSAHIPAMVITAFGSIEAAVQAMKAGAEDFVTKGFTIDELVLKMEKILEKVNLEIEKKALNSENISLRQQIETLLPDWQIIGQSEAITKLHQQIHECAQADLTILISGETGTGKELVARAIHRQSPRKIYPFVVVNCSALPRDLVESELFGYEKGAFTGAQARKVGQFEVAQQGIVLLDEVGDIDIQLQPKILRASEYKEFNRVGGTKPVRIDVQIIAATNRNLAQEVEQGRFREDLYYRLKVMTIHVPPLRERKEDIPLLSRHFLELFAQETDAEACTLAPKALEMLFVHDWPGNCRELKNLLFRAASLCKTGSITAEHLALPYLPDDGFQTPFQKKIREILNEVKTEQGESLDPTSYKQAIEVLEKKYVEEALRKSEGTIRAAARALGISRNTLKRMLYKYGLL